MRNCEADIYAFCWWGVVRHPHGYYFWTVMPWCNIGNRPMALLRSLN